MTANEGYANFLGKYNWFQAAGYSSNTSTIPVTWYEAQAGAGAWCYPNGLPGPCQPAIPVSVCTNADLLAGTNGVDTYQNPDGTNGTYNENPSKGGMSTHPAWYLNLQTEPRAIVETGSDRRAVTARAATDDERARMWPQLVAVYRFFAEYQTRTDRIIPLVVLEPAAD